MNEQEKKEMMEKYEREYSTKAGREYFEEVLQSLERTIKEVRQHQERFEQAIEGKDHQMKVNSIEWCAHYVQQINLHHEKAIRATAKLAKAFNINLI